jgi:hypothetical protein
LFFPLHFIILFTRLLLLQLWLLLFALEIPPSFSLLSLQLQSE